MSLIFCDQHDDEESPLSIATLDGEELAEFFAVSVSHEIQLSLYEYGEYDDPKPLGFLRIKTSKGNEVFEFKVYFLI